MAARGAQAIDIMGAGRRAGFVPIAMVNGSDPQRLHLRSGPDHVEVSGGASDDPYELADQVVSAARAASADVVHPGTGMLAESVELAEGLRATGIGFVGPTPEALARAANKATAVEAAATVGIPVLPHATGPAAIYRLARDFGFPLVLKSLRGGLGRDVNVAWSRADLAAALTSRSISTAASCYGERYLPVGVVVAVTVAVDADKTAIGLGERETLLLGGRASWSMRRRSWGWTPRCWSR